MNKLIFLFVMFLFHPLVHTAEPFQSTNNAQEVLDDGMEDLYFEPCDGSVQGDPPIHGHDGASSPLELQTLCDTLDPEFTSNDGTQQIRTQVIPDAPTAESDHESEFMCDKDTQTMQGQDTPDLPSEKPNQENISEPPSKKTKSSLPVQTLSQIFQSEKVIHQKHQTGAKHSNLNICEKCGESLPSRRSLELHMQIHMFEETGATPASKEFQVCPSHSEPDRTQQLVNPVEAKTGSSATRDRHSAAHKQCPVPGCGATRLHLKSHINTIHGDPNVGTKFRCPVDGCGFYCINMFILANHMEIKHPVIEQPSIAARDRHSAALKQCPVPGCGATRLYLKQHISIVHGDPNVGTKFRCPVDGCGFYCIKKCILTHHMKIKHPVIEKPSIRKEDTHCVPTAGPDKENVSEQPSKENKSSLPVQTLSQIIQSEQVLHQKHQTCAKHSDLNICEKCGESFLSRRSLEIHIQTHMFEKSGAATLATKELQVCPSHSEPDRSPQLANPVETRTSDPAKKDRHASAHKKCPVPGCGATCFHRKEHISTVHGDPNAGTQLRCPFDGCGFYCIKKCILTHHMKTKHPAIEKPSIRKKDTHHAPTDGPDQEPELMCDDSTINICTQCGESFLSGRSLEIHIQTHMFEKPDAATLASKKFQVCPSDSEMELMPHTLANPIEARMCDLCGVLCESHESVVWHRAICATALALVDNPEVRRPCDLCGRLITGYQMKQHRKSCYQLTCSQCIFHATSRSECEYHRAQHNNPNAFHCHHPDCLYLFDSETLLNAHEQLKHPIIAPVRSATPVL